MPDFWYCALFTSVYANLLAGCGRAVGVTGDLFHSALSGRRSFAEGCPESSEQRENRFSSVGLRP